MHRCERSCASRAFRHQGLDLHSSTLTRVFPFLCLTLPLLQSDAGSPASVGKKDYRNVLIQSLSWMWQIFLVFVVINIVNMVNLHLPQVVYFKTSHILHSISVASKYLTNVSVLFVVDF